MQRDVVRAIEELSRAFPSSEVTCIEDGQGGAYVIVESVDIGSRYAPAVTWLGGHIGAQYPYADIYPFFMGGNVRRVDGGNFEPPISAGQTFADRPAIQISRRNNRMQHSPQTAVAKFLKIIDFLEKC